MLLGTKLFVHGWSGLAAVAALSFTLAGCGGTTPESSSGGTGGSTSTAGAGGGGGGAGGAATGGTGGTATGGTGGAPQALTDQGITQNDCGPADGPALAVRIGSPSMCDDTPNAAPQVWFLVPDAQVGTLTTGVGWDYVAGQGGLFYITWYPQGNSGAGEAPKKAHLEVLEVGATTVRFKYTFETADASYGGDATVTVCDNQPLCG